MKSYHKKMRVDSLFMMSPGKGECRQASIQWHRTGEGGGGVKKG